MIERKTRLRNIAKPTNQRYLVRSLLKSRVFENWIHYSSNRDNFMVALAGFATTVMIARFANELCRGMVEMTVINELAFPTSRRYRR